MRPFSFSMPSARLHGAHFAGAALALIPTLALAAPPPAAAPTTSASAVMAAPSSPDQLAASRALYKLGAGHIEKKQWEQAYEALNAAWKLTRHWQIAMMLGWAELELGKIRASVEHLSFAAADTEAKTSTIGTRIGPLLLEAKSKIVYLRIDGAPAGARLSIDGETVAIAPMIDPVPVDLGEHTITGELGNKKVSQSINVPPPAPGGDKKPLGLTLHWSTDAPPSASQKPSPSKEFSIVPVVALAAGAGVGLVVMGVMSGLSIVKEGEAGLARDSYDKLPGSGKTDAAKKVVGDLLREHDTFARTALGLGIGSALLGVAAGTLYFVRARKNDDSSISWAPVVSPSGGGLIVRGAF